MAKSSPSSLAASPEPQSGSLHRSLNEDPPDGALAEKNVLALINSAYLEESAKKDKELVESWTETINIILIFGGLLSAVITAFLIAQHPDLKAAPHDLTNYTLLRILKHLDNSTTLPPPPEPYNPPTPTIFVLAVWHTSLGCSLTSIFGALLSKLWVLHYQSNPHWADAEIDQSRLREARFNSLEKWKMYLIIETLPVILQIAVFLFYLGLAQSLHPTKPLFAITVSFATLMGTLFVGTLLSGAFFPSCPYKSSLSSFTNKAVGGALFWSRGVIKTVGALIYFGLNATAEGGRNTAIERIRNYWSNRMARRIVEEFEYGYGERSIVPDESYSPGVFCWWLQTPRMWKNFNELDLDTVIDAVMEHPVESVVETERWKRNFEVWSLRVFRRLRLKSPVRRHQLQVDMVCYFMHHSPKANASAELAIKNSKHRLSVYDSTNVYICKAIRWGFASGNPIWSKPLPVVTMRPTTFSVYLRYQLLEWGQAGQEMQWNRDLLLQELPAALNSEYFEDLNIYLGSLVNAVALTSIALVPGTSHQGIYSAKSIANSRLTRQLLRAIHRMSYFSESVTTQTEEKSMQDGDGVDKTEGRDAQRQLVRMAVSGAWRAFSKVLEKPQENELYDAPSWEDGSFVESLGRLMDLGRTWWHAEPSGYDPKHPGARLVHELHDFISRLPRDRPGVDFLTGMQSKSTDEGRRLSPDLVEKVFLAYAHPSTPKFGSNLYSRASNSLDYILSLRFYHLPTYHLTPLLHGNLLHDVALSRTPQPIPNFKPPAHFIRQLIADLHKQDELSLSIVVKGKDMLLPPRSPAAPLSQLEQELEWLFESMFNPGNLLRSLSAQAHKNFKLWDELIVAIESRAKELGTLPPDPPRREMTDSTLIDGGRPAEWPAPAEGSNSPLAGYI